MPQAVDTQEIWLPVRKGDWLPWKTPPYIGIDRPKGMHTARVDVKTNARIKNYLYKDVLQVANDDIFTTGDYEPESGHSKRPYDVPPAGQADDPERSLEESKRRARGAVRDIALCNRFTHMFTWTLNGSEVDRYDAVAIYKKMRSFLSNATQRKGFRYVCIPEYHTQKKGETAPAIHMHGLCQLGDVQLQKARFKSGGLRKDKQGRQVYNMLDWKLGWSTCVELDENYERAVNYVTKYITKNESKIFGKWYLSSRDIQKKPDIIPLERIDYNEFRDESKLESGEQAETTVYLDVKVLYEEYARNDNRLYGVR